MTSSVSACSRGWSAIGSSVRPARRPRARRPRSSGRESRCIFSPWKAGSISLRCSRCGALVEQDHRVRCRRPARGSRAPSPGCRTSGGAVKISLDLVRVGDASRTAASGAAEREALAVARAAALEEGTRAGPPAERLQRARQLRPGGQVHVRNVTASSGRSVRCSTHRDRSAGLLPSPWPPPRFWVRPASPSSAVVGLGDASPGEYPAVARITFGPFLCTGTLDRARTGC